MLNNTQPHNRLMDINETSPLVIKCTKIDKMSKEELKSLDEKQMSQ